MSTSLKQGIMIKSQFTVKMSNGKGSRGSSPSLYLKEYVARDGATEPLLPAKEHRVDDVITRYDARSRAVEDKCAPESQMYNIIRETDGTSGVAFGSAGISYSAEQFQIEADRFQKAFENRKTVIMPVFSFSRDYLAENNIIPEDFYPKKRGDYRGKVDQLKLREAVVNGMRRLERRFDKLLWMGAFQFDTMNVHVHLALVDLGRGIIKQCGKYRGQQVGMLSEKYFNAVRRGIDVTLDVTKELNSLSKSFGTERSHAREVVRRELYAHISDDARLQLVAASLPKRGRWRAKSNDKAMKRANELCREYVLDIIHQKPEEFKELTKSLNYYAFARAERLRQDDQAVQDYIDEAMEKVIVGCMDEVYQSFREMGKRVDITKTSTIAAAAMDVDTLAAKSRGDDYIEFCIRFRNYGSRLKEHKERRDKLRRQQQDFRKKYEVEKAKQDENRRRRGQQLKQQSTTVDLAIKMIEYFDEEVEYETMCMAKYQYLLGDLSRRRDKLDHWRQVAENLTQKLRNLKSEGATRSQTNDWMREFSRFSYAAAGDGWLLTRDGDRVDVRESFCRVFDDVKAVDLQDLRLDFPTDAPVSETNIDRFAEVLQRRERACAGARLYLEESAKKQIECGQAPTQLDFIPQLPTESIEAMHHTLVTLRENGVIKSCRKEIEGRSDQKLTTFVAGDVQVRDVGGRVLERATTEAVMLYQEEANVAAEVGYDGGFGG